MGNKISLGCMRLANLNVDQVEELIKKAVSLGITFFDHADIYGNGRCEELFGEVLARNKELREKIIIQTKCGIRNGFYDFSKDYIIEQVKKSIENLKCGYIDILLLHRPDALVDYEEVNQAFDYLYKNGLVKEFGVSNMNPLQIELFKKYVKCPIKYNQIQLSIVHSRLISQGLFVNTNNDEAISHSSMLLEYCKLNDIEIQAWSPLMASWEDGSFIDNDKYYDLNQVLFRLAQKYQVSKNAIAISFILRHPFDINVIVGTTSCYHLEELVKARDVKLTKQEWYELYQSAGHRLP